MKKLLLKLITCCLAVMVLASFTACTYRQDGSVIQDVTFKVSYLDDEEKNVDIDVTASFYKTFAPETCDHLLKYVKDGYYENSSLVMNKDGNYFVLGAFNYNNGAYEEKAYTGNSVVGEFKYNGWTPRLKAEAGSLVLLREPDTGKGGSKYDSGKVYIAIILNEVSSISNQYYSVFGKINAEALEDLKEVSEDVLYDSEEDIKVRYIGDRDEETDSLTIENGKYVGGYEFYLNFNDKTLKDLDKKEIEKEISEGVENELYTKLSTANDFDLYALPTKNLKVANFKLK
ncbi:MAG: peptidylprolyl isomerase [Clostridia bacterium]|nr:peptidylprolyl isomerase [Clostridia bacterium]